MKGPLEAPPCDCVLLLFLVTSVPSEFPLTGVSDPNTHTHKKGPGPWLLALPHDPWRHVAPYQWRHNAGPPAAGAEKNSLVAKAHGVVIIRLAF